MISKKCRLCQSKKLFKFLDLGYHPPSDQFNKFVITPTKKIISNVRKLKPDIKFIGFPKGIGPEISTYISETGMSAFHFDSKNLLFVVEKLRVFQQ